MGSTTNNNPKNQRNVKPCTDMTFKPHDTSLQDTSMLQHMSSMSLKTLEKEGQPPSNVGNLDAILLRVVASNGGLNGNQQSTLCFYGPKKNVIANAFYSRLLLCKSMSKEEKVQLFYLVKSRNANNHLWTHNPQLRDDGTITMGTIFGILAPLPIMNYMSGDIPMVELCYVVIVMCCPTDPIPTVPIDYSIEGNTLLAFAWYAVVLNIHSTTPKETKCADMFCNKQQLHEIVLQNCSCGCYHMLGRQSYIAFHHLINVQALGFNIVVEHFSSTTFSNYYLSGRIPSSVHLASLQMTKAYFELVASVESVVGHVNNNGGWSVIGWYKCGVVVDKTKQTVDASTSNTKEDAKMESGEISFHDVTLRPMNADLLNSDHPLGRALNKKKYNISDFENGEH
eukprot:7996825-Ditylum_brightwellii.AAC.1